MTPPRKAPDPLPQLVRADRLRDLLHDCIASAAADQALRLGEALQVLASPCDRPAFEAMVACAAYESAALLLLGSDCGFLLSRGSGGLCLASAVFAEGDEEVTAQAATPALALLCAHLAAVLAAEERLSLPVQPDPSGPSVRLH